MAANRRLRALGAVLVAGWVLAGCSYLNPFDWWKSDPNTKIPDLTPITATVTLSQAWRVNAGSAGDLAVFYPALASGHIYTAARDGTVTRLDAATGRVEWRVKETTELSGGVGADDKLVVVGNLQGEVLALSAADGSLRWRGFVSSEVLAPPVVAGDLVLVRSSDSRIFALDTLDGRRKWVYQRSATSLAVRNPAGLVVSRGNAFAGFPGGKLVSIALSNGGVRWESTVSLPRGTSELERVTDVVGLPWLSDREVCAVAFQGRVACFDLGTGAASWTRDMSSVAGLTGDARYLYIPDEKGAVNALDRSAGTSVWKQDRLLRRGLSVPLARGGQVIMGDVKGYVHVLSRDSGALIGRFATDGSAIAAAPMELDNGRVLIQTRGGELYALDIH